MKLRLKYGFKMLFRNPVRIAASFLAAIIALGITGMCIFTSCYSTVDWERDLYFNYNDDKYTNISLSTNAQNGYYQGNYDITRAQYEELHKQIQEIGGEYAILTSHLYGTTTSPERSFGAYFLSDRLGEPHELRDDGFSEYNGQDLFAPYTICPDAGGNATKAELYRDFYRQMTVYSSEKALDMFGYSLVGKLPSNKEEIAVPQWLYNCFLCYGYKDVNGEIHSINSEEDLIGKTIQMTGHTEDIKPIWYLFDATIVGVVHTDYEAENFYEHNLDIRTEENKQILYGIKETNYSFPPHIGLVISMEYLTEERLDVPGDSFIDSITVLRRGEHAEEYFDYLTAWRTDRTFFQTESIATMRQALPVYVRPLAVNLLYWSIPNVFHETTIYFQIVPYLGIFAAVLLMYLCFSTVMGKRRGVGIMQSMGATKGQVIFTIGLPILLFCLVCSLGALCVEVGFLSYMNGLLSEMVLADIQSSGYAIELISLPYPFTLGWETWLFTFGVPIAIAAVTTLVTVWLVFRTPVLDNLNKKDFRLFRKNLGRGLDLIFAA